MANPFKPNSSIDLNLQALQNNPMFQMLKGRGLSYEQIVKYMCNQRGINFDQFMDQAKELYKGNSR